MNYDNWVEMASTLLDLHQPVLSALAIANHSSEVCNSAALGPVFNEGCSLWKCAGLTLLGDHPGRSGLDSVFPPHPESVFLTQLIPKCCSQKRFLDVGVGSGIVSVFAASAGWETHGVDINPRALEVAHINAVLNGVKVTLSNDNLGESYLRNDTDLCVANLPFEPTPEVSDNFLHSDGGLHGDKWIRRFLKLAPRILAEDGVAIIPAFSLFSAGSSRLETAIEDPELRTLDKAILRLSQPLDIRFLFARYQNGDWKSCYNKLRREGYESFVVEVLIIKNRPSPEASRIIYRADIAGEQWVAPLGYDGIAIPTRCAN